MNTEREQLEDSPLNRLRAILGEVGTVEPVQHRVNIGDTVNVTDGAGGHPAATRVQVDAVVTCSVGGKRYKFLVECKKIAEPRHLPLILQQIRKAAREFPGSHPVLAADHLSEGARRELQEQGIGFVDGAGNVHIKFGTVLIDRQILSPVARPKLQRPLDRLASRKYARVLRVLLEHHDRAWGVKDLSQEARVSFRHAWVALDRLAEEGWVEKKRGQNRLAAPGTLLDFWAKHYPWRRHRFHRFYAPVRSFEDLLERLSILPDGTTYALTGPAGSMLVAPFVTFAVHYLYFGAGLEPFHRALDLRPVETGGANIVLVEPDDPGIFYGVRAIRGYPVACNTQLYLDLMALGGRGKDQATHLREQVMKI